MRQYRHVLTAEYPEGEHLLRRKFRSKFGIEIAPGRLGEDVSIASLHLVVNCDLYISLAHERKFNALAGLEKKDRSQPFVIRATRPVASLAIRAALERGGAQFIDKNGRKPDARLRKSTRQRPVSTAKSRGFVP